MSTATNIKRQYTLTSGTSKFGYSEKGKVAHFAKGDLLYIFFTEDGITSSSPPFELEALLAEICCIEEPHKRGLLRTILGEASLSSIQQIYYEEGLLKREDLLDEGAPQRIYLVSKLVFGLKR